MLELGETATRLDYFKFYWQFLKTRQYKKPAEEDHLAA